MRLFGAHRIAGLVERLGLPDDQPINARILSNSIEGAHKRIEDQNFKRRKNVLTYDDVMNQQRNLIYQQRHEVLNGEDISGTITSMIATTIAENVEAFVGDGSEEALNLAGLEAVYKPYLLKKGDDLEEIFAKGKKPSALTDFLTGRAMDLYEEKVALFGEETFREVERSILLQSVDSHWMEHIDTMDDLKGSIGLQAYAQRDPVNEYRLQGADMFDAMIAEIREETVRRVLTVIPRPQAVQRVQLAKPMEEHFEGQAGAKKKTVVVRKAEKIGRNDLCPCGSGKKYKKCCGANGQQ